MVTIPYDWCERQLQDICVPSGLVRGPFGGSLKKEIFQSSGKKVYEQRNAIYRSVNIGSYYITDDKYRELIRFSVAPGDFIVSCSGTIGKIFRLPQNAPQGVINQALLKISLESSICDPEYFYKYFEWYRFQDLITDDTQGGAMKNLVGMDKFKKTEFAMPKEISEQKEIAKTLSKITVYIDDLSELIEKKKGIRDGALDDLITKKTRIDGFADDWTSVTFNQVITPKARIGWQGLKKHEYLRSGYSYLIGGTDFSNGTVSLDNISYVSKERYDMDMNIQVSENDVLVTKDGTIGKVAIVPKLNKPATLNSGVFVFRTNSCLVPAFLFRVLQSSVFREFIDSLSAGSTIKHLYQKDLKKFEFEIPVDTKEQEAIAEVLTAMDEEILELETEREKIVQIREGAMDDLLTGRVRLTK